MNVADTDRMELLLFHSGYNRTPFKEEADLILVNTCSVREKAEQKIFSLFGTFQPLKKQNPDLLMGLTGCLAQQEGQSLLNRIPGLDFILGPDTIESLPTAIDRIKASNKPLVWTEFDSLKNYSIPELPESQIKPTGPSAFVNIIKGCDKFCSFCIVPFTRGREKSREAKEILEEVSRLVDFGAKEIILLGQNVNAYGKRGLDVPVAFHELLYQIVEVPGLQRLRFTTSYPRDFTPELVQAYRDIDALMNHLHLPVQSGNDRILDVMRRQHTAQEYLDLIGHLKNEVPDIALSTDIIVGFPGETNEEFEDTLKLMEAVRFDNSYMFCYSPRPGTPAEDFPDTVSDEEKKERLQRTIDLQNRITLENAAMFKGKVVEVLIEEKTSRYGASFKGRSPHYWMVNVKCDENALQVGDLVSVLVEEVMGRALVGKLTDQ